MVRLSPQLAAAKTQKGHSQVHELVVTAEGSGLGTYDNSRWEALPRMDLDSLSSWMQTCWGCTPFSSFSGSGMLASALASGDRPFTLGAGVNSMGAVTSLVSRRCKETRSHLCSNPTSSTHLSSNPPASRPGCVPEADKADLPSAGSAL